MSAEGPNSLPRRRTFLVATTVLLLAAVAVPVGASLWARDRAEDALRREALVGQLTAARSISAQTVQGFEVITRAVVAGASGELAEAAIRRDSDGTNRALETFSSATLLRAATAYDSDGGVVGSAPAEPIPLTKRPSALDVSGPAARGRKVYFTITAPLIAAGSHAGFLVAELDFAALFAGGRPTPYRESGTVTVAHRSGLILSSTEPNISGLPLLAPLAVEQASRHVEDVGDYFAPRLGYQAISAYAPGESQPWGTIVVAPKAEILGPVRDLQRQLFSGAALFAVIGMLIAGFTTTADLRYERRLRRAHQDLLRANADLDGFAAVAAHDLRAPLSVISGYSELLGASPSLTATERNHLLTIRRHAHAMADLIGDLLAYARAANAPLETATVDVAAAASEAAGRVGHAVAEREAEIVLPYESVLVQADERQLVQMLQNLIANAIVYCPPDRRPRVVVSARRDNGTSEIEVADNGAASIRTTESACCGPSNGVTSTRRPARVWGLPSPPVLPSAMGDTSRSTTTREVAPACGFGCPRLTGERRRILRRSRAAQNRGGPPLDGPPPNYSERTTSAIRSPASVGLRPICTPAARRASIFA